MSPHSSLIFRNCLVGRDTPCHTQTSPSGQVSLHCPLETGMLRRLIQGLIPTGMPSRQYRSSVWQAAAAISGSASCPTGNPSGKAFAAAAKGTSTASGSFRRPARVSSSLFSIFVTLSLQIVRYQTGSITVKTVRPPPLSAVIVPLWSVTICLAMARPSPAPLEPRPVSSR